MCLFKIKNYMNFNQNKIRNRLDLLYLKDGGRPKKFKNTVWRCGLASHGVTKYLFEENRLFLVIEHELPKSKFTMKQEIYKSFFYLLVICLSSTDKHRNYTHHVGTLVYRNNKENTHICYQLTIEIHKLEREGMIEYQLLYHIIPQPNFVISFTVIIWFKKNSCLALCISFTMQLCW